MNTEVRDALNARRKLAVLQYAEGIGNVKEACRDFNVPRSTFYRWKRAYLKEGRGGGSGTAGNSGGAGGRGGQMDTSCGLFGDFNATSGLAGLSASGATGPYGGGGGGGSPCGVSGGGNGEPGRTIHGNGGAGAAGGGFITGIWWAAHSGQTGSVGQHGNGGGGGGGAGGHSGAGGGGAGGISFSILARNSAVNQSGVSHNGGSPGSGGGGGNGSGGGQAQGGTGSFGTLGSFGTTGPSLAPDKSGARAASHDKLVSCDLTPCLLSPVDPGGLPPAHFALQKNVPNPFNPSTEIRFSLARAEAVHLTVHDLAGRVVRQLIAGEVMAIGNNAVVWDGRDNQGQQTPSGTYLVRLVAGQDRALRKVLLLK